MQGFYVVGLDYFFGDTIDLHNEEASFDRNAWFAKSRKQATEATPGWVKAVREIYGARLAFTFYVCLSNEAIGEDAKYTAVGELHRSREHPA